MHKQSGETTTNFSGLIMGLLGIVFVTLKLTGFIDWSWWYVTMPFWLGAAIGVAILIVAAIIAGVISIYHKVQRNKVRKGY
jgi:ABC-type antimicrobial peptide transport system permease subunit